MTKVVLATRTHRRYCLDDLIEKRRNILRDARTFSTRGRTGSTSANCRVAALVVQGQDLAATNTNQG
jgi:hypothetical protein